jgi:NADH:ubiquinone oxidoreductase subunit F (NADH-binding)
LVDALESEPTLVIEKVLDAGLRGRGGAYFPAGLKWKAVSDLDEAKRYLVVNCEEGEPGVFKDRHLMEGLPYRVIEGAMIAAYSSRAHEIFIYVNAEAHLSSSRIESAVKQCYDAGLCGDDVLGSGYGFEVFILHGAGGYVCGEETTLLNTMEGFRREPRVRPPFPTEAGYLNQPTVINNAETLANIPYIISQGSELFKTIGLPDAPGCKIISLSGFVERPGVIEVPMGTSIRHIVEQIGNVPQNGKIGAVAVGGPSSGILPVNLIDTIIKPGFILEPGVMLGAGGMIVIPEGKNILNAVKLLTGYNATESCGKCTPCREGNPRMLQLLAQLNPEHVSFDELDDINSLAMTINASSLCGLGQASGNPILSLKHHFENGVLQD